MTTDTYDVHVAQLSPQTTEQHLHEFFSFCGKIASLSFDPAAHTAVIRFEKPSAAKTALMLNGGTLDGAHLLVTSPTEHPDHVDAAPSSTVPEHIDQTDKPRSAIAAEYLARGYTLSDQVLQKAIAIDTEHGISKRFLEYFHALDKTVGEKALGREQTISGALQEGVKHASERARQVDEQRGISTKATDYYTRALASPWGQKVKAFYTTTSKQVFDIHEEAKRIAAAQHHDTTTSPGAAPLDPATTATAGAPTEGTSGGDELKPKTTEAPTVV